MQDRKPTWKVHGIVAFGALISIMFFIFSLLGCRGDLGFEQGQYETYHRRGTQALLDGRYGIADSLLNLAVDLA